MRTYPNHLQTLLISVAAALVLGFAFGAYAQGDGSGSNNPNLLRGSYSAFCEPAMLCHPDSRPVPLEGPAPAPAPIVQPAQVQPVGRTQEVFAYPDAVSHQPRAHGPLVHGPLSGPVHSDTAWTLGYGVTLRGRYVVSDADQRFDFLATPRASWRYEGSQRQVGIDAEIGVVQPQDGSGRVETASLSVQSTQLIGPLTRFSIDGDIALSQLDPRDLDATPQGAMTAPLDFNGALNTSLSHQSGRAFGIVSAGLERYFSLDGQLSDGTPIADPSDNATGLSAGLRLGHEITPVVSVFGATDLARTQFDAAPASGVIRNGWAYGVRGGLSGNWQDVLTAEASIGYGWRTFDAVELDGAQTILYGVALGFQPDPTMALRVAFDTSVGTGRDSSAAQFDYDLSVEGRYDVNSWVGLRASTVAGWQYDASGNWQATRLVAGVGSDLVVGPHSTVALDYSYGVREQAGENAGLRDEHRVSGGITLQY